MTDKELQLKANELEANGKMHEVFKRLCDKPDLDGLRIIIRGNPEISCFFLRPAPGLSQDYKEEIFCTTDDEEFNKEGRQRLLEI